MKIGFQLLCLFVLTACNPAKVETDVSGGSINTEAPYLWASSELPRPLKISKDFNTAEADNITAMTAAWETAIQNKKNLIDHGTEKIKDVTSPSLDLDALGSDVVNGIYRITDWPDILPGRALAVTQIFGSRLNAGTSDEKVRIEHADILVNFDTYDFRTGDDYISNTFDLRTVIIHEVGHYMGLGHKYGDTVMVPSVGENTKLWAAGALDKTEIASKYGVILNGGSSSQKMAMNSQTSKLSSNQPGQKIKILIELMEDGECVHKEDGDVVERHHVKIK